MNITDFLLIGDKKGFNLWVPRVNFWHRMLAKALGAQMGLWEKELMMMDGTVLKADHSRKAAKLIRIKGVRLFKAIYTLMNGEGQVSTRLALSPLTYRLIDLYLITHLPLARLTAGDEPSTLSTIAINP